MTTEESGSPAKPNQNAKCTARFHLENYALTLEDIAIQLAWRWLRLRRTDGSFDGLLSEAS